MFPLQSNYQLLWGMIAGILFDEGIHQVSLLKRGISQLNHRFMKDFFGHVQIDTLFWFELALRELQKLAEQGAKEIKFTFC